MREHDYDRVRIDAIFAGIERGGAEVGELRLEAERRGRGTRWEATRVLGGTVGAVAFGMFLALGAARALGWIRGM